MSKKPEYVKTNEAIKRLGVCADTLRSWAETGKIECVRAGAGARRYNVDKYVEANQKVQADLPLPRKETPRQRISYAYCRVSSIHQKDDLGRQVAYMRARYPAHTIVTDIGSGLNFKRKGLWTIVERVMQGCVDEVVVAHKDRLARFAHDFIHRLFELTGARLMVEDHAEHASDEQELAEDLLSIVHVFSCRHNGKRRYHQVESARKEKEEQKEDGGDGGGGGDAGAGESGRDKRDGSGGGSRGRRKRVHESSLSMSDERGSTIDGPIDTVGGHSEQVVHASS